MPSTVVCPECHSRLRLPAVVSSTSIQCPRCQHVFSIPAEEDGTMAIDGMSIPGVPSRPEPKPIQPPPLPNRSRSNPPPPPRPRSRISTDSIGFERFDEDDNYPPRPRPRARKKSGSMKPFLLIGGILASLIVVVIVLVLLLGKSSSKKIDREMLAWVPADSNVIMGIDIRDAMAQPRIERVVNELLRDAGRVGADQFFREVGVEPADLDKIWLAGNFPIEQNGKFNGMGASEFDFCFLLKLRSPKFSLEKLRRLTNAAETNVGSKKFYRGPGICFYLPSDDLLVLSTREKVLERLISKKEGEIAVYGAMRSQAELCGGEQFWIAVSDAKIFSQAFRDPEMLRDVPPQIAKLLGLLRNATGYTLTGGLDRETITVEMTIKCDSVNAAKTIIGEVDEQLKLADAELRREPKAEPFRQLLKELQVSSSGELVKVSFNIDFPRLKKVFEEATGMNADNLFNPRGLDFGADPKVR